MGYSFAYSSPWSLARLVHAPFGRQPCQPCQWRLKSQLGIAFTIIVFNISGGGRLHHRLPVLGVAWHHEQIGILCRTWVWGRPRLLPNFPRLQLHPSGGYASEKVLAWWRWWRGERLQLPKAEVFLATSLALLQWFFFTTEIVHLQSFITHSCCPWRWLSQVAASQRGCTATLPYRQDASWRESWRAAMATATYSCNWMMTVLVLWLGGGWQQQWRNSSTFDGIGF